VWSAWHRIHLPDAKIAVDVFMVLSGFLMVHLSLERADREPIGTASTAVRFWKRRLFRIAPLYYVVVAFAFIFGNSFKAGIASLIAANPDHFVTFQSVHLPQYTHYTLSNLLMHISFLFGFVPAFASSTLLPDWSIGLEMQFYAAFPVMLFLFRRLPPISATILIFAVAAVAKRLTVLIFGLSFPEPSFLPLKMNLFLVGMLVAFANSRFKPQPVNRILLLVAALSVASLNSRYIVVLTALIFLMTAETDDSEPLVKWTKGWLARILGNPLTRFMADMSYGVYLVHNFFIAFVGGWLYRQPGLPNWERAALLTLLSLAGSYSVAYVLHHLVEKPGIRLGHRL
jgi:peptidoglycan/LPS O-acetylase OafA/YrhL